MTPTGQAIRWVAQLQLADLPSLGRLRVTPGIQALLDGEMLWVAGSEEVRSLPHHAVFHMDSEGQLRLPGTRVPVRRLSTSGWQALDQVLLLQPPATILPGRQLRPAQLRLARSSTWRGEAACACSRDAALAWIESTPKASIEALRFAARADGQFLFLGAPLPAVPGPRFAGADGILVPCGWRLEPNVDPLEVRRLLGLFEGEQALFAEDGTWTRLRHTDWQQASRSAIRQTANSQVAP